MPANDSGKTFESYIPTSLPSFEIRNLLKFQDGALPDSRESFLKSGWAWSPLINL